MTEGPQHFGEYVLAQIHRPGGTATDRGIRLLARLVKDDDTWPKVAISYSTYHRWLMRTHRKDADIAIYQLSLDASWNEWQQMAEQQNRP